MHERNTADVGEIGKFIPNFHDSAEESRFRTSRAAAELRDTRSTLLLFIAVSSSFAPLDVWLFPEDLTRLLLLRLGLVNAVLVAALALTFVPWLARRTALLTFAVTIFYVVFYALFTDIADAPPLYISGVVMLFFGIYAIAPLRYAVAVCLGWSGAAIFIGLAAGLGLLSVPHLAILAGEIVAVNAIGMFTLYRLERLRRLEFRNLNEIAAERSRYHDLLVRILPATIAERMRTGEQHIADRFKQASVLFVDIVDFTRISAQIKSKQIVALLERVIAAFDALVKSMGWRKSKLSAMPI